MKQRIGFLRLRESYFSVRMEVLYNMLTEFGISMIGTRMNKYVCVGEPYS